MTRQDATTFGLRVRFYRQRKGLTTYALAARLGVSRNTITQMETNVHTPNAARVQAIAKALGIPAGALFPRTWNPVQRKAPQRRARVEV